MSDLTRSPLPTELDPEPTLYGTGRINELVAPDGSTELSRAVLWLNQRAARYAFGARLRAKLVGSPIAEANIRAQTQPLRDYINDQLAIADPIDEDEIYGDPITSWGPNDG